MRVVSRIEGSINWRSIDRFFGGRFTSIATTHNRILLGARWQLDVRDDEARA